MATPYERRQFNGAAVLTSLSGDITPTTTSITIADSTGWPDGSVGPFSVVIDKDTSTEEKIQVTSRTAGTLDVVSTGNRGRDGTTAVSHSSGAPVMHVGIARDLDEANYTTAQTVGKITTAEDLLVASAANTFKRVPKGTDDQVLTMVAGILAWADVPEPSGLATEEDLTAETEAREGADTLLSAGIAVVQADIDSHEAETTTAHGGPYLGATADAGGDLDGNYPNPTLAPVGVAKLGTDWPTFAATKTQTCPDSATTTITFTTAQEDWKVGFTHATGTGNWVANRNCFVNLSAWLKVPGNLHLGDGEVNIVIRQNGTDIWQSGILAGGAGASPQNENAHGPAKASVGDIFTCAVYQDTGGSLACDVRFAATFAGSW
jgi:hypothetical protein